ncbi:uncharacterized protein LOC144748359 [Ciona intestinalis]
MSFNFLMPPPTFNPTQNIDDFINVFTSYCESVKATEDVRRHMLLTAIDADLRWQIQGKDKSVFSLSLEAILLRARNAKSDKGMLAIRRNELFNRRQDARESNKDFAYSVKSMGDLAYPEESPAKDEIMYLALINGLHDKQLAQTIPQKLNYAREFWFAAQVVLTNDNSSKSLEAMPVDHATSMTTADHQNEFSIILTKLSEMERESIRKSTDIGNVLANLGSDLDQVKQQCLEVRSVSRQTYMGMTTDQEGQTEIHTIVTATSIIVSVLIVVEWVTYGQSVWVKIKQPKPVIKQTVTTTKPLVLIFPDHQSCRKTLRNPTKFSTLKIPGNVRLFK